LITELKAKKALAKKIRRKTVEIHDQGTARYGRMLGRIYFEDRDISKELVAEGHAWVYRQYMTDRSLLEDEESARSNQMGL